MVHQETDHGQQHNDRKHRRDLHRLIVLHQQHSKAGAGADELAHHRAEDRQHRGDAEAREQERQTARDDDLGQQMQLARVAGARQLDALGLDRLIPRHHGARGFARRVARLADRLTA